VGGGDQVIGIVVRQQSQQGIKLQRGRGRWRGRL
jgi:hypothetical protein